MTAIPIHRARRRRNAAQARIDAREAARDAFLRAAAALTEPATVDTIAFALLEASFGIQSLARADKDGMSQRRAIDGIRATLSARRVWRDGVE